MIQAPSSELAQGGATQSKRTTSNLQLTGIVLLSILIASVADHAMAQWLRRDIGNGAGNGGHSKDHHCADFPHLKIPRCLQGLARSCSRSGH